MNMNMKRTVTIRKAILAASIASLGASPALAQSPSDRPDTELGSNVAAAVSRSPAYGVFDSVEIDVVGRTVTLSGFVTMPDKRSRIERRVAAIAGVREVINHIEVLPLSRFDDDLRHRIARDLYGRHAFWQYAAMPNPPIHILVTGGRVTLTGVVNNHVDRMLATTIATNAGALRVENRLKTEQEVRRPIEVVPRSGIVVR